jgi:hypothetical protein
MAGRGQTSLYGEPDVEAARLAFEQNAASGAGAENRAAPMLDPQFLVGELACTPQLGALLHQLQVTVVSLVRPDFDRFSLTLQDFFAASQPAQAVQVVPSLHDLLIGTSESALISYLRRLRFQGLATLGYHFFEGQQEVAVPPAQDMAEQHKIIDDLQKRVESSPLFTGELSWLKDYAGHELALMRVELSAAEAA